MSPLTVTLTCTNCGDSFTRERRFYERDMRTRRTRNTYCSWECFRRYKGTHTQQRRLQIVQAILHGKLENADWQ